MFREHERVALTYDIPAAGLVAGTVEKGVGVYGTGGGFEVEFTADGQTIAVVTLSGADIHHSGSWRLRHPRPVSDLLCQ